MAAKPETAPITVGCVDSLLAKGQYQVTRREDDKMVFWSVLDVDGVDLEVRISKEEIRGWSLGGFSEGFTKQGGGAVHISADEECTVFQRGAFLAAWPDTRLAGIIVRDMREVHVRLAS